MAQEQLGELVPVGGGDAIPLIQDIMTIGRRASCDIQLDFANISGSHAELAKPLAGHLDVDAVWTFSSTPISAVVEKEAAGNLKRTWVNHARARDWFGAEGEGRQFLRAATEVKTIWIPYGE